MSMPLRIADYGDYKAARRVMDKEQVEIERDLANEEFEAWLGMNELKDNPFAKFMSAKGKEASHEAFNELVGRKEKVW